MIQDNKYQGGTGFHEEKDNWNVCLYAGDCYMFTRISNNK